MIEYSYGGGPWYHFLDRLHGAVLGMSGNSIELCFISIWYCVAH